ncbi:hypothetical protein GWK47_051372 [Chionoecetes opilio]|uniref:Uncharacterized protein n=1 Tax=Chionoecetes opilio TaxID=41210 RepID=A0A8J4Y857_CHIOP|nr:hypothetical protein GWK47_051372 [Chionoecetes opilio]
MIRKTTLSPRLRSSMGIRLLKKVVWDRTQISKKRILGYFSKTSCWHRECADQGTTRDKEFPLPPRTDVGKGWGGVVSVLSVGDGLSSFGKKGCFLPPKTKRGCPSSSGARRVLAVVQLQPSLLSQIIRGAVGGGSCERAKRATKTGLSALAATLVNQLTDRSGLLAEAALA